MMMMFSSLLCDEHTQCFDGLKKVLALINHSHRTHFEKEKENSSSSSLKSISTSTHFCCALVITDTRTLKHSNTHNNSNIFSIFFHT